MANSALLGLAFGTPRDHITSADNQAYKALALRFTDDDCDGADTLGRLRAIDDTASDPAYRQSSAFRCYDRSSTPAANFQDLRYMTCPISADVTVYAPSGQFEAMYAADECGQLWRIRKNRVDGGAFSVKRLAYLNSDLRGNPRSIELRKVFGKLQVVRTSNCEGGTKTGIAFGTGNVQRPFATQSGSANYLDGDRGDIVGLIWEQPDNGDTYTLNDLYSVRTGDADRDDEALERGWYLELEDNEKSLRDPLLVQGLALFQTFSPYYNEDGGTALASNDDAHPCSQATGVSYLYRMDMCTGDAAPAVDVAARTASPTAPWDARRETLNEQSLIGSNMEVFVSPTGQQVVFAGDDDGTGLAVLDGTGAPRGVKLMYWRLE